MPGLVGEKIGMTQIFGANGAWIPVTVIKAGPCTVIQKKTVQKEGYSAVQLGYGETSAKKKSKPEAGHFEKKNMKAHRFLREIRTEHVDGYAPGDLLTVVYLEVGDKVCVTGVSKGKGFQGVMKRHHFAGGNASHGCSISHRSAGSIGQRTFPGKVFKGKRMAGHMGSETVTVKNLKIVGIEAEDNLILVGGAVPGANHSLVVVRPKAPDFENRFLSKKGKKEG